MKVYCQAKEKIKSIVKGPQVGLTSLSELNKHSIKVCQTYPSLSESVETSDIKDVEFIPDASTLKASTYRTPKIEIQRLKNIYFCPEYNILHTKYRKIIKESISTQTDLKQFKDDAFLNKKFETIKSTCSLFRSHKNCFYHTVIDNLPRLYLLNHESFHEIDAIKILLSGEPSKVESFYLDKLLPKNAKLLVLEKEKLYKLKNLLFPSFLSRRFAGYLPREYREWFLEKVAPARKRDKRNRIFISRIPTDKGSQRCILNEKELFSLLKPYGFQRYVLEHMSIEEQIGLFYDADAVVAAHGAGLTNTIFSEGIRILELFPAPFIIPHYYYLAKSVGHSYRHLCSQEKKRDSDFTVNLAAVSDALEHLGICSQG